MAVKAAIEAAVDRLDVSAYTIPTDEPESDGTARMGLDDDHRRRGARARRHRARLHVRAAATATLVDELLADVVAGSDALEVDGDMGGDGEGSAQRRPTGHRLEALSAVDTALWDLKARLLDLPLVTCSTPCAAKSDLRQRRLHVLHRRAAR